MLRNCRVIVISCYKDKEVSQCLLINTFSHMSLYMYNKKAVLNRWRFKKYDIYCIVYHSKTVCFSPGVGGPCPASFRCFPNP